MKPSNVVPAAVVAILAGMLLGGVAAVAAIISERVRGERRAQEAAEIEASRQLNEARNMMEKSNARLKRHHRGKWVVRLMPGSAPPANAPSSSKPESQRLEAPVGDAASKEAGRKSERGSRSPVE